MTGGKGKRGQERSKGEMGHQRNGKRKDKNGEKEKKKDEEEEKERRGTAESMRGAGQHEKKRRKRM